MIHSARPRESGDPDPLQREFISKVAPSRVAALNQFELPHSIPFFELALALERAFSRFVHLKPNKGLHTVLFCKAGHSADAMLLDTPRKIVIIPV